MRIKTKTKRKITLIMIIIVLINILIYQQSQTQSFQIEEINPSLATINASDTNTTNQDNLYVANQDTANPNFATQVTTTQNTENQLSETNNSSTTAALTIHSEAAILIDAKTGKVLYGKNEEEQKYPASTTKILTAIIALERLNLTDKITASYEAVMSIPAGYSNAAIQPGETLTFQELLDMFLIHSANEVGYILAEHISGSVEEFANLMNQKALEIGCTNTHFTNPSGIQDENHYSTAHDMALIAKYCMQNEEFRKVVAKPSCTIASTDKYEERYFVNTNDLLRESSKYYYPYAIGIKTGYTSQAKNCLIAASSKDGLELITVVLGAQSLENGDSARNVDTINLFEYGFSNYKFQTIANQNGIVQEITVPNATEDTENLQLLLKDSISSIVPANFDLNTLDYEVKLNDNLSAPIAQGSIIGTITYHIDGLAYTTDLLASHDVEKSNLPILIAQIVLAILVLFLLAKMLSPKKNNKHLKKKKYKKSKHGTDSIYKFN